MQTWIALLRGINVGGKNILPMKELRALLEDLGFQNARTYIQSGNCVFESDDTEPRSPAERISDRIEGAFGFRPQIMVLTADEIKAAVTENPYLEGPDDPKSVHLYFLSETADAADLGALARLQKPGERFALFGRVFYLLTPEGIGRSKLASQAEKCLGVAATARNLRSVKAIAELAG